MQDAACDALPAGGAGEDRLEKYIADNLLPWAAADFAPEEGGVVDEDTYVQQGRDLERAYSLQVINYMLGTLRADTELAMVGTRSPTRSRTSSWASSRRPSPAARQTRLRRRPEVRRHVHGPRHGPPVEIREGYIRSAYEDADEKLGVTRKLMGGDPTTFAGSDHGFAPQSLAVNARKVLLDKRSADGAGGAPWTEPRRDPAQPQTVSLQRAARQRVELPRQQPRHGSGNGAYVSGDLTKACWAGGTIQVYVTPTLPAGLTYAAVRARSRTPSTRSTRRPGKQVTLRIMKKEELRNVDGSDSLHPNRSGDVAVVLQPAVPVGRRNAARRSRCRTSSASTATCRTTSTSRTTSTCTRCS